MASYLLLLFIPRNYIQKCIKFPKPLFPIH